MFSERRVTPDVLFDPGTEAPPGDCFDVQFRVPLSLTLFATELAEKGYDRDLDTLARRFGELIDETVRKVQFNCGDAAWGRGVPESGRLAITSVIEPLVPGHQELRPHAHVYVGATVTRLRDGERGPVDEGWLRQGVFGAVYGTYGRALEARTAERFGLTWALSHGGVEEIVDPPYADRVPELERAVCPGPWGPRRLILADEADLHMAAKQRRLIEHQRAIGYPGAR